jgi:hypothetical protein
MKNTILSFFILGALIFSGCAKKTATSSLTTDDFYDVVYVATQYRAPGTGTWFPTAGLYQMQFLQDTTQQTVTGTFAMHYTSYLESNLCPYDENCVCSGGITGSFSDGTPAATATDTTAPYDPWTTYVPTGSSTSGSTLDSTTDQIYVFYFALNIQVTDETVGCANGHKFNQPVVIYRFSNGDLIVTNDTSQLYMVPQTTSN